MDRPELGTQLNIDGVLKKQYVAPMQGQDGTPITAQDMNALFNELIGSIEAAGLTPDADANDQIAETIRVLSARRAQQLTSGSAADSPYGARSIYGEHIVSDAIGDRHIRDDAVGANHIAVNVSSLSAGASYLEIPALASLFTGSPIDIETTYSLSPAPQNLTSGSTKQFIVSVHDASTNTPLIVGSQVYLVPVSVGDSNYVNYYDYTVGGYRQQYSIKLLVSGNIQVRGQYQNTTNSGFFLGSTTRVMLI